MDDENGVVVPFLKLEMFDRSVVSISYVVGNQTVLGISKRVICPSDAAFTELGESFVVPSAEGADT